MVVILFFAVLSTIVIGFYLRFMVALLLDDRQHRTSYPVRLEPGPACRILHTRALPPAAEKPHKKGTTRQTSSGITNHSGLDLEKESPPVEAKLFS